MFGLHSLNCARIGDDAHLLSDVLNVINPDNISVQATVQENNQKKVINGKAKGKS